MQDKFMIGFAVMIWIGIVLNFAAKTVVNKEFEACVKKENKICLDGDNGKDEAMCREYAVDKCLNKQ